MRESERKSKSRLRRKHNTGFTFLTIVLILLLIFVGTFLVREIFFQTGSSVRGQSNMSPESISSVFEVEPSVLVADEETKVNTPPEFSRPDEMKAVFLKPGRDFLNKKEIRESDVLAQMDRLIADTTSLSLNTIAVYLSDGAFRLDESERAPYFGEKEYFSDFLAKCRAEELYVYVVYDIFLKGTSQTEESSTEEVDNRGGLNSPEALLDEIHADLWHFTEKYQVDSVLLTGFDVKKKNEELLAFYRTSGLGVEYDIFLRDFTESAVKTAVNAVRVGNHNTQVGLLVDAVWANKSQNENGTETTAVYQQFYDGHVDTKRLVELALFDFIVVENAYSVYSKTENFESLNAWWAERIEGTGQTLYISHAVSYPWKNGDQLAKQVLSAKEEPLYGGSFFDSLAALLEDKNGGVTAMLGVFTGKTIIKHTVETLQVSNPVRDSVAGIAPSLYIVDIKYNWYYTARYQTFVVY